MLVEENPELALRREIKAALRREIKAARRRAGLTQAELALRMGTKQTVIARLEDGRRSPTFRTLMRLAKTLGASGA
jgi:transcriptional regulator with XRE-family HTH domain